ncbi:MAG: hypothetical protein B6D58_09060, partial [candidate division Zixibacteria bacterium 4484_95]
DVGDPVNPTFAGGYDTPGYAWDVFVTGGYVYVADINSLMIILFTSTDIKDKPAIPQTFALHQNYPNTFNSSTVIEYSLPARTKVSLDIYNLLGQKVTTLYEGI